MASSIASAQNVHGIQWNSPLSKYALGHIKSGQLLY